MDGGDSPTQQPHHQPFQFSPILIGLLGIILGAIMVAAYQCIAISCNYRSGPVLNPTAFRREQELSRRRARPANRDRHDSITMVRVLRLMPVFKFTKGREEGTCAVCLGEFTEGEELRTLPQCSHSFHAPCVDMWLFSHANCPLCRAGVFSSPAPPPELRLVVAMPMSEEGPPAGVERSPELGV